METDLVEEQVVEYKVYKVQFAGLFTVLNSRAFHLVTESLFYKSQLVFIFRQIDQMYLLISFILFCDYTDIDG